MQATNSLATSDFGPIARYFRGEMDEPGKTPGKEAWLDLCRYCGQEPRDYDDSPSKLQLSIEHWHKQHTAGPTFVFLDPMETDLNNGIGRMTLTAQPVFFDSQVTRLREVSAAWLNTGANRDQLTSIEEAE